MKKLVAFILTALLVCSFCVPVFAAAPPQTSAPTEGTAAAGNVGSAEGHKLFAMMTDSVTISLTDWRNSITEVSSGTVSLYGMTQTNAIADRVDVNFTLQQWNGSSWVTYSTCNNSANNTNYYAPSTNRSVAHGYYYRVKTVHAGYLGIDYDSETLYSSYIYVS